MLNAVLSKATELESWHTKTRSAYPFGVNPTDTLRVHTVFRKACGIATLRAQPLLEKQAARSVPFAVAFLKRRKRRETSQYIFSRMTFLYF